jgi:hypothetical protein
MSDIYDEYREAPQGCGGTMIGIAGIIIIIVLLLVGCKTQYIAGQDTERIVEVHHHDTTIVTEADSASAMALLECDSAYNVVLRELTIEQGKRIVPSVTTKGTTKGLQIDFDCKEDSLLNIIAWQDSIIRNNTTQTIVKVEKQKDFVWYCGVAFIIIIVLYTIWNVARVVLKFYGIKL